jgi:multidrug resistance efflux pump
MNPDPLPPVPSPPEHHWRQFRVNVIPGLAFVLVLGITVWLWGKNLANPLVMGQAESIVTDVASPKPGRIEKLNVALFQEVKAGDVIAVVDASDPQVLINTLAVIRAEMGLIRAEGGLDNGDKIRLADFRLSWMIRRAELAASQAQLIYARDELERASALTAEKIDAADKLDIARRDFDQVTLEVEQKTLAVTAAEKSWRELDPATTTDEPASVRAALAVEEQKLRLAEAELQPITLTAPISGRISKLDKLAGATVVAGDPIATIANPTADRIIGYLSQPLRIEPKVGMRAEIRSRGLVRRVGEAQVTQIGPRIELFDAPLRVRGMGAAQERGLPIIMSIPPNMNVRPGEIVDIRLLVN